MATRKETLFEAWEFTAEEYSTAVVFTDLQLKHIQTEIAVAAAEKMNLVPRTEELGAEATKEFMETHAYLRGKIDALGFLLATSIEKQEELAGRLASQVLTQDAG